MITIHDGAATDFSGMGLGALDPSACTITEEDAGEYELHIEQPADSARRQKLLQPWRIIKAPAPVRESPLVQESAGAGTVTREIYKVATPSGQRLRLRKSASMDAGVISKYKVGTQVALLETSGSWGHVIVLDGGADGWMWRAYLTYVESRTESVSGDNPGDVVTPEQARDQLFRIYKVTPSSADRVAAAEARHITYDLLGAVVVGDYAPEGVAANTVVAQIMAKADHDAGFTVHCDITTAITGDYGGRNVLDCLLGGEDGIVPQLDARVVRDNYDIWILPGDTQRKPGAAIRYGKNLVKAQLTTDVSDVVSRIIPEGKTKGGDPLTGDPVDSAHAGEYPVIHARRIQYDVQIGSDGIKNEAQAKAKLKEKAEADYSENGMDLPAVDADVEFVRLEIAEEYTEVANREKLHLYDQTDVIDREMGILATVRMTGYTWDALAGQYEKTELGEINQVEASVYGLDIAAGSVGGTRIIPGSITGNLLGRQVIEARHISADSIRADMIQAGAVTADKIAAGAITAEKVAAGAIEADKIAAEAVTADKIAAGAVTAEKVAAGAIEADKIAAGAVDTDKLAAGSVTAEKIEAGSITADRMKAKTITAESGILADGVVGTAQIADSSITTAKIVELSADVITAGTLSVKRLILVGEDGLIYNINAAASGLTAEELTDEKYQNQINGTVIVAKSITAAQIAAESITGNEILAQSITAGNIDVAGLFADEATIAAINAMDISSNSYLKLMVETAVDDVQVGGRNYLLGTGEAYVAESDGSARTWLFPWKCADEDTAHSLYGKTVTVSFDYDQAITSGAFTLAFHHTWGTVKVFNAGTAAGQRFEETFDLPVPAAFAENDPNVVIYIDGTWNGSVTFRNLKLEIGNKATDWTPAPEDGYKSSYIEIRDDHVDIGTGGTFRVASGDVDISTSKFSVSITDEAGGEDELLTIDATGVRAANLSAPNVAMRYDGPWQIIVNSGATSAQVESGSYVRSMQEAFDRLNDRFLPYYAEVKLETDTYENVSIHGIYAGNASLAIVGQGHTVYGRITISNINAYMRAINLKACNANGDVWWIDNCRYVSLNTCTAEGYSTASAGYHIDNGSVVTFGSCEVYNCVTGVDAGWGTNIDIAIMKGTTTQYAYKVFGTRITNSGSRPSGDWTGMNFMAAPGDLLTVPIDTGSGVVVPTTGSATFNPSATGTYTTYWWNIDSDIRQGYTKSNGRIKGGIFYAISGVGSNVASAILRLTRLKGYGKGSAVQVKVYGTTSTGKSGNPALSTEGYVLGTIDNGQTADFALPAALATGLGNGTYKGIILYAGDTSVMGKKDYSTNYARFAADAPLTITWTT